MGSGSGVTEIVPSFEGTMTVVDSNEGPGGPIRGVYRSLQDQLDSLILGETRFGTEPRAHRISPGPEERLRKSLLVLRNETFVHFVRGHLSQVWSDMTLPHP